MPVTFRAGVGMVVLDDRHRALAFERSGFQGAWQLPQGGIEEDEDPADAMWRELREETGLTPTHVSSVADVSEWLGYELPLSARSPKTGRGQVHKWFILRTMTTEVPIQVGSGPEAEFRSWRWVDLGDLADLAVSFRQPVYRRLAQIVAELRL
jgi:putative (di)nucleoside polyphosphate hydrolase